MSTVSRYPHRDRLLQIVQAAGLKREGLVADAIFPRVQTPGANFEWIDWSGTDGKFENLRQIDDKIGCYSTAKNIDPSVFEYKQGKVNDYALEMFLKECNLTACGELPFDIEAQKTEELVDRLLLNREIRAASNATNTSIYGTAIPYGSVTNSTDFEGARITGVDLSIGANDYLEFFMNIQDNNSTTGPRNVAVMNRRTINQLRRHPSFKSGGCAIPPIEAPEVVANLMGVDRVAIADAYYNVSAAAGTTDLVKVLDNKILMLRNAPLTGTDGIQRVFGFSAFEDGLNNMVYFDPKIGKDGSEVQKVSHDFTDIIADVKSATLIELA